jgi:thiol:disulfide interchange protein DsbD
MGPLRSWAARALAAVALGAAIAPAANGQPAPPGAASAPARVGAQRVDAVEVELVAERTALRAGASVDLGLRLRHDPHWHTYWRNPGDSGLATQLALTGPAGARFGSLRWPAPKRLWVGPLANYGYEDEVVLPFEVALPRDFAASRARVEAHAMWLVCKDVCIPGEARVAIELPVAAADAPEPARSAHAPLFEAAAARLPDPAAALVGGAHRDAGAMVLSFATPPGLAAVARAEFFPYGEGVVAAPAPQTLSRTQAGWRLDLVLADGARPPDSIEGVLVADGRPFELRAETVAAPAPAATGAPVSVAAEPAAARRPGGGLLAGAAPRGSVPASTAATPPGQADADASGLGASLALALAFGALGGAILNLMPCVFPVVGLKVLGFAQSAGDPRDARRATRTGAAAFAAGVLVSFWLLAGAMLALRAAGESIGWGFQLQSPAFVATMALLFVAVGLNFSGVYELGLSLTRLGGVGGHSTAGAFASGVLAVLVATPCTAPFMGSALGFTLSQPAAATMAVFTAIGLGMAAPYLLLGLFPGWIAKLPRPGRWMQTLRQALAFPMYATAAWLAWVLAQQAGVDAMLRLLLAAVALGVAAWAWGRFALGAPRRVGLGASTAVTSLALAALLLAPVVDPPAGAVGTSGAPARSGSAGGVDWEPWSERRVADALAQGRTVFVDFTAAWCVSCQANKKLVLERDAVAGEMARLGVVALRADWTQRDPAITAALARHGRNGVPLYLVHRPDRARPQVLPELLTASVVLEALR